MGVVPNVQLKHVIVMQGPQSHSASSTTIIVFGLYSSVIILDKADD